MTSLAYRLRPLPSLAAGLARSASVRCLLVGLAAATGLHLASAAGQDRPMMLAQATSTAKAASANSAFSTALSRALAGKHHEALSLAAGIGDPLSRKIIEWQFVQSGSPDASFERIIAFLRENPGWPQRDLIERRAEQALYNQRPPTSVVRAYFAATPPRYYEGMLALARAELAEGRRTEAARWAGQAWRDTDFSADGEKRVLAEFGGLITDADHRAKLVRLIYDQKSTAAMRTAARISEQHVQMARAAHALLSEQKDGPALLGKVSPRLRDQLVMRYPLARYHRRKGDDAKARVLVVGVPSSHGELSDPYPWWVERRLLARQALQPGQPAAWREAYQLARAHGYSSGQHFQDGEFLAGWIALRYLRDPRTALAHFTVLRKGVTSQAEVARAEYWLGRTRAALGEAGAARSHFEMAARYVHTYYGQLARDQIGLAGRPIPVSGVPSVSDSYIDSLSRSNEVLAAAQRIAAAGQKQLLPAFFSVLASRASSQDEAAAIATVAWRLGMPNLALRTARTAASKGFDLGAYAFPVNALPSFKQVTAPVDPALIYGLIRQESEFNPIAASGAGARGLMQIMPETGKLIARAHKQPFTPSRLTSDPGYSLMLGSAHLHDLIRDFNGSYIMTLVAYNAGPRRVSEWVQRYGDPRKGEIDPIDWVEAIPFTETRDYVQKVMANVMAYRTRLTPGDARGITAELHRGRFGSARAGSGDDGFAAAAPDKCGSRAATIETLIACN